MERKNKELRDEMYHQRAVGYTFIPFLGLLPLFADVDIITVAGWGFISMCITF